MNKVLLLAVSSTIALAGCVAVPAYPDPYAYGPAPVVVAPAPVVVRPPYIVGSVAFGGGHRGWREGRHWR